MMRNSGATSSVKILKNDVSWCVLVYILSRLCIKKFSKHNILYKVKKKQDYSFIWKLTIIHSYKLNACYGYFYYLKIFLKHVKNVYFGT